VRSSVRERDAATFGANWERISARRAQRARSDAEPVGVSMPDWGEMLEPLCR
jgi:hypothetical protein